MLLAIRWLGSFFFYFLLRFNSAERQTVHVKDVRLPQRLTYIIWCTVLLQCVF